MIDIEALLEEIGASDDDPGEDPWGSTLDWEKEQWLNKCD